MPKKKVEPKIDAPLLKCGTVAIIGRPNVGKSTLLNTILGEKISIVSNVPQTTRSQIRGIFTDERGQIIFIDTPGMHLGSDGMDKFMNRSSTGAIQGVDLIIHLVDSSERTGPEEEQVVKQLKSCGKKIIIGLNKVDVSKGKYVSDYIKIWETARGKPMTEMTDLILFPLSALKAVHIKELIDLIFTELPTGPMLYPDDIITDMPQRMAIADTIREKLFLHMREEIPHSIAVIIDEVLPKKGKVLHIKATIFVERPSQKEIVIGHKGAVLKEVGTEARKDLQIMLEHKVFLELYVKTKEKWRDDYSSLEEMGYIFE